MIAEKEGTMNYESRSTRREDIARHVDAATAKLQLLRSFIKSGVDISTCSDGLLYVMAGLQSDLDQLNVSCDQIDMTKEQCADLARLLDIPPETLWDGFLRANELQAIPF